MKFVRVLMVLLICSFLLGCSEVSYVRENDNTRHQVIQQQKPEQSKSIRKDITIEQPQEKEVTYIIEHTQQKGEVNKVNVEPNENINNKPPPSKEYYDTSNVYITVNGVKYYMKGTALYRDGEFLNDFRECVYKDSKLDYDDQMRNTLLITDLSYDIWDGNIIIFAVGVALKVNDVDFNDTSSYKNGKVKVGTPYTIMFSYNVDNAPIYPYNTKGLNTYVQLYSYMEDLYITPYRIDTSENEDQWTETYDMIFNYSAYVVHPRIIKSKYKEHTIYLLLEETDYGKMKGIRHIKLYDVDVSRTKEALSLKPYEKVYMELEYFNDIAKGINDNYEFNNFGMYVSESDIDRFIFTNEGKTLHVAAEFSLPDRGAPSLLQEYWKEP